MPNYFHMSPFYEALVSLEKFETGTAKNLQSNQFFALNRILALLDDASNNGHVIAPFFLYYLNEQYPCLMDSSLLPNLDVLPIHRSKAPNWVKAYKLYIETVKKINDLPDELIVVVNTQRQGKKKQNALKNLYKDINTDIKRIGGIDSPISNLLSAKCSEKYHHLKTINIQSSSQDIVAFENSLEEIYRLEAERPNYWAMVEYVDFMTRKDRTASIAKRHQKILDELKIINNALGKFYPLYEKYLHEGDERSIGQWLIQSAIHGESAALPNFYGMYCKPNQKWSVPISFTGALSEARLWAGILFRSNDLFSHTSLWEALQHQIGNYFKSDVWQHNPKIYISHLVKMTYQFISVVTEKSKVDDFVTFTPGCFKFIFDNRLALLEALWTQYNGVLPAFINNNKHMLTDLALTFDTKQEFNLAERFYQKAYELAPCDPITQYNLANVLFSQSQNEQLHKQVMLFIEAASSGCTDSIERLVFLTVFKELDFEVNLHVVKEFIANHPEDGFQGRAGAHPITLPKSFILSLLDLKIEDQKLQEEIVKRGETWREPTLDKNAVDDENEETKALVLSDGLEDNIIEPSTGSLIDQKILTQSEVSFFNQPNIAKPKSAAFQPNYYRKEVVKETAEAVVKESLSQEKQKALGVLQGLVSMPTRSLNFSYLKQAQKCMHTLSGVDGRFEISNKGHTSGSRVKIGDRNFHKPHGKDRMIIGAQHSLKGSITQAVQQYSI